MFNSPCWWRFIVSIPAVSELTQKQTFMAMQQGAELSGCFLEQMQICSVPRTPVAVRIILNLLK